MIPEVLLRVRQQFSRYPRVNVYSQLLKPWPFSSSIYPSKMVIFHSYVDVYQRVHPLSSHCHPIIIPLLSPIIIPLLSPITTSWKPPFILRVYALSSHDHPTLIPFLSRLPSRGQAAAPSRQSRPGWSRRAGSKVFACPEGTTTRRTKNDRGETWWKNWFILHIVNEKMWNIAN